MDGEEKSKLSFGFLKFCCDANKKSTMLSPGMCINNIESPWEHQKVGTTENHV